MANLFLFLLSLSFILNSLNPAYICVYFVIIILGLSVIHNFSLQSFPLLNDSCAHRHPDRLLFIEREWRETKVSSALQIFMAREGLIEPLFKSGGEKRVNV